MVFEKTLSLLGYRNREVGSEDEDRYHPTRRLTQKQSSPTQPKVQTYITQERLKKYAMRERFHEYAMINAMTKSTNLLQYNVIIMKRENMGDAVKTIEEAHGVFEEEEEAQKQQEQVQEEKDGEGEEKEEMMQVVEEEKNEDEMSDNADTPVFFNIMFKDFMQTYVKNVEMIHNMKSVRCVYLFWDKVEFERGARQYLQAMKLEFNEKNLKHYYYFTIKTVNAMKITEDIRIWRGDRWMRWDLSMYGLYYYKTETSDFFFVPSQY